VLNGVPGLGGLPAGLMNDGLARIGRLRRGAHHPDCYRYDHHLVRIGGTALCLGCVSLWTGVVLGAVTWLAGPLVATVPRVAVGVALTLPTIAQPFVQKKPFKVAARTALGFGSAWYVLAIVLDLPWTPIGTM
jgi:hypothetical protein